MTFWRLAGLVAIVLGAVHIATSSAPKIDYPYDNEFDFDELCGPVTCTDAITPGCNRVIISRDGNVEIWSGMRDSALKCVTGLGTLFCAGQGACQSLFDKLELVVTTSVSDETPTIHEGIQIQATFEPEQAVLRAPKLKRIVGPMRRGAGLVLGSALSTKSLTFKAPKLVELRSLGLQHRGEQARKDTLEAPVFENEGLERLYVSNVDVEFNRLKRLELLSLSGRKTSLSVPKLVDVASRLTLDGGRLSAPRLATVGFMDLVPRESFSDATSSRDAGETAAYDYREYLDFDYPEYGYTGDAYYTDSYYYYTYKEEDESSGSEFTLWNDCDREKLRVSTLRAECSDDACLARVRAYSRCVASVDTLMLSDCSAGSATFVNLVEITNKLHIQKQVAHDSAACEDKHDFRFESLRFAKEIVLMDFAKMEIAHDVKYALIASPRKKVVVEKMVFRNSDATIFLSFDEVTRFTGGELRYEIRPSQQPKPDVTYNFVVPYKTVRGMLVLEGDADFDVSALRIATTLRLIRYKSAKARFRFSSTTPLKIEEFHYDGAKDSLSSDPNNHEIDGVGAMRGFPGLEPGRLKAIELVNAGKTTVQALLPSLANVETLSSVIVQQVWTPSNGPPLLPKLKEASYQFLLTDVPANSRIVDSKVFKSAGLVYLSGSVRAAQNAVEGLQFIHRGLALEMLGTSVVKPSVQPVLDMKALTKLCGLVIYGSEGLYHFARVQTRGAGRPHSLQIIDVRSPFVKSIGDLYQHVGDTPRSAGLVEDASCAGKPLTLAWHDGTDVARVAIKRTFLQAARIVVHAASTAGRDEPRTKDAPPDVAVILDDNEQLEWFGITVDGVGSLLEVEDEEVRQEIAQRVRSVKKAWAKKASLFVRRMPALGNLDVATTIMPKVDKLFLYDIPEFDSDQGSHYPRRVRLVAEVVDAGFRTKDDATKYLRKACGKKNLRKSGVLSAPYFCAKSKKTEYAGENALAWEGRYGEWAFRVNSWKK